MTTTDGKLVDASARSDEQDGAGQRDGLKNFF
jgi:hypothetical protein